MDRVETAMNGSAILQTETRTGPTAQTRNRRVIEIAPISRKAPIYRKYVKRREKTETIKCPGTNILVGVRIPLYCLSFFSHDLLSNKTEPKI